jgi:hypothetical protein
MNSIRPSSRGELVWSSLSKNAVRRAPVHGVLVAPPSRGQVRIGSNEVEGALLRLLEGLSNIDPNHPGNEDLYASNHENGGSGWPNR